MSTLKLGWRDHLDDLLAQPQLVEDHLRDVLAVAEAAASPFERRLVQWCIENVVPFRQLAPGDACLVFYEDLCVRPAEEAARVLRWVGQEPDEALTAAIERPSALARPDSAVQSGGDLVGSWRSRLSEDQMGTAVEILRAFGLADVYGREAMPDTAAGQRLLASRWSTPASR